MKWVFWISLSVIIYTYAGYPLWLWLRRLWRTRPVMSVPVLPSVSIVMAVHNEAETLPRKLRNLWEINYPPDRCEIIVVSDGSTDETNRILAAESHDRLRALLLPQHQGKASALNRGIQAAKGEILVFTDARPLVEPSAVRHLVANFADPAVGCVSGDISLEEPNIGTSVNGLGVYWKMETFIRRWEGATGSLVGAAGCLYAVRRELVVPLPPETILDDVYLPLNVARQGARVVFEPGAQGCDRAQVDRKREFRRKVRTLTGNYQLLKMAPWLLTRANPVRFEFVCHKLLRLLVPFALTAALVSSLILHSGVYKLALLLQLAFYMLAVPALLRQGRGILHRLGDISLAFLVLNAAALVAFLFFLTGKKEVWVR